jgi:hypothetical protein
VSACYNSEWVGGYGLPKGQVLTDLPFLFGACHDSMSSLHRKESLMSTERQIEANRLNAQKSTGPVSSAGKARCSANALKSGLYAQSLVIGREQAEDFHILQTEYYDRHQPATAEARVLVDTLIRNEWLLRRLTRIETELWDRATDQWIEQNTFDKNYSFAPFLPKLENSLAKLQARMNACDRSFRNALRDLTKLQSTHQPIATEAASPEIGFVPSSGEEVPEVAPAARQFGFVPQNVGQAPRPAKFGFVPKKASNEARTLPPAPALSPWPPQHTPVPPPPIPPLPSPVLK